MNPIMTQWYRKPIVYFGLVIFIYALTIILNDGFMATDEYFTGITRYIPAQTSDVAHLVHEDDVKSPLQILPMHLFAQLALKLGVESPYWQYRFVLAALAILNCALLGFVFHRYHKNRNTSLQLTMWLLFAFYFAAPFTFTRPMFESLAAPWLALAALYGSRYDRNDNRSDLLRAVLFVSISFVMRQQVGLCALAMVLLPLLKKRWTDFYVASLVGLGCFILAGIPDYFLRGSFHHSLISILQYNVKYGSDYATHPIYTYPLLIFALTLGPWWIMKYSPQFWREHFRTYRTEWMILGLFVLLHSSFPQKWERFLISMIPILIILMTPLVWKLWSERSHRKIRFASLLAFNFLVFIPATFFPPQKNLISLSLYLDQHQEIESVYRVNTIPEWITDAFIRQPHYKFVDITSDQLSKLEPKTCHELVVVAEFMKDQVDTTKWIYDTTMPVNMIEALAYKLNPTKNVRRAPLSVFKSRLQCS